MSVRSSRSRRTVALIAAVTVTGVSGLLTAPSSAHAAPGGCAATFNLFIPGTWETDENADPARPVGMLEPVADALTRAHGNAVEIYTLPYMARAFDNGHTYADSKADAVTKARKVLVDNAKSCPGTNFTIVGYSQGADAAGDIASDIGNGKGPIDPNRVLAVGLLADPRTGTPGTATVGPQTAGQGIADPRPQGMGVLSGRVASICDPGDLYCSIDKDSNPLLGSLGSILSKTPSIRETTDPAGKTDLVDALTSDFSDADLSRLDSEIASLGEGLAGPDIDFDRVAKSASSIARTLAPLADLLASGAARPALNGGLESAPTGSDEHNAAQVLDQASKIDVAGVARAVNEIADIASALGGRDSSGSAVSGPELQGLSAKAEALSAQIQPLSSLGGDVLVSATDVLSVLEPKIVVDQVLNVATGVTSLDVPGIVHNLTVLPQKVAALDAQGAHQIAGELNNQFSPLVKMAAAVDLQWMSQILAAIPDPSGTARIAALVASILSHVDVLRLADIVGRIQEVTWSAVEKLLPPPGIAPDPPGAGAAMTGLLPLGLELASVATDTLTGRASKPSTERLEEHETPVLADHEDQSAGMGLSQLSESLIEVSQSQEAEGLASLVSEGLSAASFFGSTAHTNYNALVVDNAGRSAIQWLSDWLNLQIGRAV